MSFSAFRSTPKTRIRCFSKISRERQESLNRYLIITTRKPSFQLSAVTDHFAFLDTLRARGQLELSGAFTDKTGGAYVLLANTLEEATDIAFADPLNTTNSSAIMVHEWAAK